MNAAERAEAIARLTPPIPADFPYDYSEADEVLDVWPYLVPRPERGAQ